MGSVTSQKLVLFHYGGDRPFTVFITTKDSLQTTHYKRSVNNPLWVRLFVCHKGLCYSPTTMYIFIYAVVVRICCFVAHRPLKLKHKFLKDVLVLQISTVINIYIFGVHSFRKHKILVIDQFKKNVCIYLNSRG